MTEGMLLERPGSGAGHVAHANGRSTLARAVRADRRAPSDSTQALLRRNGEPGSERFALDWSSRELMGQLLLGEQVLAGGNWLPTIALDGQPVGPVDDWEQVCRITDREVDYVEVQATWEGGLEVQRQVLLARQDRFLLVADALLGDAPRQIDYACRWPLAPDMSIEPAGDTCEAHLAAGRHRLAVLPLALPEWRSEPGRGELRTDAGLELRQSQRGRALFAALWIDLEPRRRRCERTWRRLTVAELLRPVGPDVAVGFRVQVGRRQWVVYRSLGRVAPRSLLGLHTTSDFVVARFPQSGMAEPLLDIE
jgi:hypothetical protein